jgi:TATA-box binding protein (TBP) (component of TFIID and TFIIIB)
MKVEEAFREFHVKVFNTGKIEIPGVQSDTVFEQVLELLKETLQNHMPDDVLDYKENSTETVLINSNFKCGFYINREALYDILRYKYNIQAIFDPCSYPGIQCKFYYNPDINIQSGSQVSEENKKLYNNMSEVSFMIFRTGSVLIVGKCVESVLLLIYEFLKNILIVEYKLIRQRCDGENAPPIVKDKKKKLRKKNIIVSVAE